jgi:pimeloyl-ACP methyl ester carboxylesterase
MTLALRNPHFISALIPVDNSPIDATLKSDFGRYVQGMRVVEEAQVTKQSDADAILQKYEKALPIRQFLLTNLTRSPDTKAVKFRIPIKTLASSLAHLGDFPFRDPDEARYEGPTLFVRGTRSHYVSDEALPLIGRFFPRFELLDIESGHWVISEKPEEFRKGVVDFLQRQSPS